MLFVENFFCGNRKFLGVERGFVVGLSWFWGGGREVVVVRFGMVLCCLVLFIVKCGYKIVGGMYVFMVFSFKKYFIW